MCKAMLDMLMAHNDANWERRRPAGDACLRRQDGGSPSQGVCPRRQDGGSPSQGGSNWESRRPAGDIPYLSAEFPDAMNSASSHFSSMLSQTEVTKHNLPHWGQSGVIVFITFRLADSLPTNLLAQWQAERDEWIAKHPEPWDVIVSQEYAAQFPNRLEEWLDAGHGECLLGDVAHRKIVSSALEYFNGDRYILHSYVVMPNHIHVLVELNERRDLQKIVHSWKSFTAKEINNLKGTTGAIWQRDYFDRLVRNAEHYDRCVAYIRKNVRAARCILRRA